MKPFFEPKPKRLSQQDIADDAQWDKTYEAVQREMDAILASEGEFHVRGLYFVSADDASKARMQLAVDRVRARATRAQIEIDVKKAQMAAQVKALFESNPNCTVCGVPIESLEQAAIFTPMGGKDVLVHNTEHCFAEMVTRSIGRYANRGRVLRSAAS